MASDLVSSATSEKLTEMDWTKNIEICEIVAREHRQAKDVVKAIKKRLGSKSSNTQLFSVMLLEMLINNIGDPVHKQVVEAGVLPILVKIVKKKSDLPVREKIFLLLDAAQTSVGGASGRFPQYYSAYYELVNAGVKFPQRPNDVSNLQPPVNVNQHSPPPPEKEPSAPRNERNVPHGQTQIVPESSFLQKAGTALEVLRDVLNAIDSQHPDGAKDDFTLDLVEQCSFEKQRVMHLAVTSRDERLVLRAIELNEQLETVLRRHDALVSGRTPSAPNSNHVDHVQEDEEEEEQLFRRLRKGKACIRSEDEASPADHPLGFMGLPLPGQMAHRPLIRPLTVDRRTTASVGRPLHVPNLKAKPAVAIPPPPAKHVEREKFFQENNKSDVSSLNGHTRKLSLHRRNASSSGSASAEFSD